jgi:hypothetical protein
MDITFSVLVAAVFLGNILTAAFIWGMSRAHRVKESELSGLVYLALLVPIAAFMFALIGAGSKVPFLAALGVQ